MEKLNYSSLRPEASRHKFVGRTDAVHLAHARQHLNIAHIEFTARSYCSQNGLACAGRAMHLKTHIDQVLDHLLDLLFRRLFLHCYDHFLPVASLQTAAVSSPGGDLLALAAAGSARKVGLAVTFPVYLSLRSKPPQ